MSAEMNPNTDPMGHEQDTNEAGTMCRKSWEKIQKIGGNTANKHDEKWATALQTFEAQKAKIETCCCLKVVRKQVKSAKPKGVKTEKGLEQPVAKELKPRVKVEDPRPKIGVKKPAGTLSKVETTVVHEEPGVVRMTTKQRAAIQWAAHTLPPSVCERIERTRQWQFVEAEKRRIMEQAAEQGNRVREGRSDHCIIVWKY